MLSIVACGLGYLHDMDIVHKNVQIVRSFLHPLGTLLHSLRGIFSLMLVGMPTLGVLEQPFFHPTHPG